MTQAAAVTPVISNNEVEDAADGTSRGLRALGNKVFLDLLVQLCSTDQLITLWNEYLALESKAIVDRTRPKSFVDSRRVFREAMKRSPKWKGLTILPSGELTKDGNGSSAVSAEEEEIEDVLNGWGQFPKPVTGAAVAPPPPSPVVAPAPAPAAQPGRVFSPLENQIFWAAAKKGNAPTPRMGTQLDPDVAAELAAAADEANRERHLNQQFILWVCTEADRLLQNLTTLQGQGLWDEPIVVLSFPDDTSRKVTFVRSSTAPVIANDPSTPTVKHDFRANELPVNHAHPEAFRQIDGQKVIRSKTIRKGAHEYYVKALNYQNGMVFKGYFVVDGVEDTASVPPRFFQIKGPRVWPITESDYQKVLARKAAGLPLTG